MRILTDGQSTIIDGMIEKNDEGRLHEVQWIALDLVRKAIGVLEELTPTARAKVEVAVEDLLDSMQWTIISAGGSIPDGRNLAKKCRCMAEVLKEVGQ